jgi:hypothetical protein
MIKPTIGRQVWYWRNGPAEGIQPEAATVCYVHGDSIVNLQVINHNGLARQELEVSLRQPEYPEWTSRHCEWMPYQISKEKEPDAAPVYVCPVTEEVDTQQAAAVLTEDVKPKKK